MRIHNHISALHMMAIGGAIGLAVTIGLLLTVVQSATQDSVETAQLEQKIQGLARGGQNLNHVLQSFTADRNGQSFMAVARLTDRWFVELSDLRQTSRFVSPAASDMAIEALEGMLTQCRKMAHQRDDDAAIAGLDELRNSADRYVRALDDLEHGAVQTAKSTADSLARRQRLAMLIVAVLGIIYLAAIEHTRHWTARRLVRPVEDLANAALQAMKGEKDISTVEQCGTKELNELAKMLSSFVETLKSTVSARTAELENQKEELEREVVIRRCAEEQLRHVAFHDRLTGLCNRELLLDRLDHCIEVGKRHDDYRFGVLFLDIDRFKEINDSLGHSVGDKLLIAVADRLNSCLRSTDTLARVASNTVARIGGDEFVILLDGIESSADATLVAQRLQESLAEPLKLDDHELFISASIGIASRDLDHDTPDNLLRDADAAMYHAKASGKARHEVFDQEMHARVSARLQLGNDLRRAIENGEFVVYYQPIVTLPTGSISGFEALVRWRHPERGLVTPLEFIAHTEETGLIVRLGQWVMQHACRQLRTWHDEIDGARDLTMNVNVSRRQMEDSELADVARQTLDETGLEGNCLNLEITESVIMANPDSVAEVLGQLKDLGVQIHMDDFGTGYSSLSCLHRFPIDLVKIDQEFMRTMDGNRNYAGVIKTVVALAHSLNMLVTVEGVETKSQLNQLLTLSANYAQGYFLSRPLPADDATRLITSSPNYLKKDVA